VIQTPRPAISGPCLTKDGLDHLKISSQFLSFAPWLGNPGFLWQVAVEVHVSNASFSQPCLTPVVVVVVAAASLPSLQLAGYRNRTVSPVVLGNLYRAHIEQSIWLANRNKLTADVLNHLRNSSWTLKSCCLVSHLRNTDSCSIKTHPISGSRRLPHCKKCLNSSSRGLA
jgi:hypothetical protein